MSNNESVRMMRTGDLKDVFNVAFPLIMSSGAFAFKLFCDRMMMAWYSERSIAAALSAGIAAFMFSSFFMGVANYCNAFVAQYTGAKRHERTGLAVWQAILFSLAAGLFLTIVGRATVPFFEWVGHPPELAFEEEAYYLVLTGGSALALLNTSLMCFWTGRNKTWTVVVVAVACIFLNVCLNWALIFGASGSPYLSDAPWPLPLFGGGLNWLAGVVGAPALGVVGAGIATVATDGLGALIFFLLFISERNRRLFGTWPKRVFDYGLMKRILVFGFGSGMQMFLDVGAFAVFNVLMGLYPLTQLGGNYAAASGVAISVNGISFVPMLGVGAAASIMVGHGIGAGNIPLAERAVRNARYLIMGYMAVMCVLFEVKPEWLVSLFSPGDAMNAETKRHAVNFLRFAGMFCLSDGLFILYGNAIRGAGDTKFSMYVMALCGWGLFALPCLGAFWLGAGPYVLWSIIVVYGFVSAGVFYWRYRGGKWKSMKVIEDSGRSQRRKGPASVRLSTPVVVEKGVLSLPGDEDPDVEEED